MVVYIEARVWDPAAANHDDTPTIAEVDELDHVAEALVDVHRTIACDVGKGHRLVEALREQVLGFRDFSPVQALKICLHQRFGQLEQIGMLFQQGFGRVVPHIRGKIAYLLDDNAGVPVANGSEDSF
jgi:hypothetical protein